MEAPASLMELLEGVHDPRGARGKRHPLPALLGRAVVALLAGMTGYEAFADYGKNRGGEFLRLLGFARRRGLCKATDSRVFRRSDAADFEDRVGRWVRARLGPGGAPHPCLDGKTNEHKAALELLGVLPLAGAVVTGDAMFTHRDICAEVIAGGGDYVLPVKENQPTLGRDIAAVFAAPVAGLCPAPGGAVRGRDRARQ